MSTVELTITDHLAGEKTIFSGFYTVSNKDLPAFIEVLQNIIAKYPKQVRMETKTGGPTTVIEIDIGALTPRPPVRSRQTFEQLYRQDRQAL